MMKFYSTMFKTYQSMTIQSHRKMLRPNKKDSQGEETAGQMPSYAAIDVQRAIVNRTKFEL